MTNCAVEWECTQQAGKFTREQSPPLCFQMTTSISATTCETGSPYSHFCSHSFRGRQPIYVLRIPWSWFSPLLRELGSSLRNCSLRCGYLLHWYSSQRFDLQVPHSRYHGWYSRYLRPYCCRHLLWQK